MISTELANISDWFLGHAAKGESIPPRTSAMLAKVLFDLSQQARNIERLPVDLTDAALVYADREEADVH